MHRLDVCSVSKLEIQMKKTLVALALAGAFVGGAQAQSSVTLYGIIDMGLQYNTSGQSVGTAANPAYSQESAWGINSGYQSGSRFGLRGSEALGHDWSAIFTLEGGYDADTGNSGQGGRLFGRQSWVGLQNKALGSVVVGRVAALSSGTGSWDMWGSVDPFATGFGLAGLGSTFIMSAAVREDNSILWQSPSWGGLKLGGMYSFNVSGAESAPQGNNTSAYGLAANFTWGPLFTAITYDVFSFADSGSGRADSGFPDQKMLQVGGTFDFKIVKLHAAYADQKNIAVVQTFAGGPQPQSFVPTCAPAVTGSVGCNYQNQAWMLGASVPLFGGSLLGSYQYSNAKNIINGLAQYEPDYSVWGLAYSYPFSRRTNAYIGYANRSWDGSVRSASGGVLNYVANAFDRDQFAIGIRHLF
jgi:GBP family porin